jgi:hypothetical protein
MEARLAMRFAYRKISTGTASSFSKFGSAPRSSPLAASIPFATLKNAVSEGGRTPEREVAKSIGRVLVVMAVVMTAPTRLGAEDDFPIAGTYTENKPCAGADASVMRVKITAGDIDSPILGLCSILGKKRDGNKIAVNVECKGPGGAVMLGDVVFTIKPDNTLDFADQDNTYKAVLYKCSE